jgi:hypothetical protein
MGRNFSKRVKASDLNMKVVKVEWKRRRIMKQHLEEVFITLSDGTVLVADGESQNDLFRGKDIVLISSQNLPREMQMANTENINSIPEMVTDDPVIIGLVSELIYAIKNGKFVEKVEVR